MQNNSPSGTSRTTRWDDMPSPKSTSPPGPSLPGKPILAPALDSSLTGLVGDSSSRPTSSLSSSPSRPPMAGRVLSHYGAVNTYQPKDSQRPASGHRQGSNLSSPAKRALDLPSSTHSEAAEDRVNGEHAIDEDEDALDISGVGLHAGDLAPAGVTPSESSPALSTPGLGDESVGTKHIDAFQWGGSPLSAPTEAIVPWDYVGHTDNAGSGSANVPASASSPRIRTPLFEKSNPVENTTRHTSINLSPSKVLTPLDPPGPFSGQQRSSSAANGRSSSLTAAGTPAFSNAPGTNKKLKNPFAFLRKRSSHLLRDGDIPGSGTSPGSAFDSQRKASAVSASSRYSSPPPSATASRPGSSSQSPSMAFFTGRGSLEGSFSSSNPTNAVITKGRPHNKAGDMQALGIDEEVEYAEYTFAGSTTNGPTKEKKRRLGRPLTREKEARRTGSHDDLMGLTALGPSASAKRTSDGTANSSKKASVDAGQDQQGEIGMTLDMNFDQIDDIVDSTVHSSSASAHVGPKDEPLSDEAWGQQHQPPGKLPRPGSRHQSGGHTVDAPLGPHKALAADAGTTRASAPNISLSGVGSSKRSASPASHAGPLGQADYARAGLRKISFAEVQKLSQWDGKADHRGRRSSAASPLGLGSLTPRSLDHFSATAMQASRWSNVNGSISGDADSGARDLRKASAISRTSARSGVSPKSSAVSLALPPSAELSETTAHWSKQGFADPSYEFPPSGAATAVDLEQRKGSAGSTGTAGNAASSWAAPDSWAVQPDKADEVSAGDNSSDNDSQEAEQTLRSPQQSRKGSILSLGWSRQSVSSGGHPMAMSRSRDNSSAGGDTDTASSNAMTPSASMMGGDANGDLAHIREQSSVEALTPAEDDGSTSPSMLSPMLSRGGALASAANTGLDGGDVASKGNLARGGRQRAGPRPSTSGAAGPSTKLPVSTLNAAEEADATGPANVGATGTKRPAWAAQSNQLSAALARNYILRIDTPFGTRTVSVPLFANASEIRSIIARKSVSATGAVAYRLFVRDKGSERPLGESEKPALLQRRRMEQAGYTEADGLETLGREDHSYLLKFVYRPDSVPNFDSESFGNTEDRFSHLDLSNRNIEMVPIFVYRHADWISFLDLSANPMSDLPTDFIQLCSNLRTLRLSALTLKRVPQSIRNSETLTHLDLSNNRIPELNHIALDQVPQLRSLKIQNNRLAELPPYFSRMKALKQLNISNNRFEAFPSVICNLSALSDLDISFNSIPSLDPGIGDLKQLESLILVGNSVESLPEAISGLSSLRKIDLRRNGVQDVSALFRLETLSEAHCEHNSIKALDAVLAGNLRSITLGHNPLSKMTIATSARSHLVKLDLSAANLSRLDDDLVGHLRALRDLNLDDNQFLSLPDTLGQLTELQVLKCTNNHLASLPESIGSLSNLKWLLVHNNNLKSLPNSIWQCAKLDTINASSNLLESFPLPPMSTESRGSDPSSKQPDPPVASAVSHTSAALLDPVASRKGSVSSLSAAANTSSGRKLPPLVSALKKLRLADNRLTHDVLDVLGFFVEVEVLNLSFNEIYEVPQMSLAKLTKLRELYLSGNSLTSVPTDDLVYMKRLRILHINANRLLTLPAELGQLTDLANLDVGNNTLKYNIANWQFDWNWNSNPGLRYLNLSGNKRLEIKTKVTGVTGGRKTDASDFQRLLNLRVLSLIDVTVLLQTMPEENDNRRVRTSLSQINNMSYGMSDALGRFDNLNVVDVVIPQFRGDSRQCVFGLFEGRGHSLQSGSRIAKFLSDWVKSRIEREMAEALAHKEEEGDGDDIRLPDRDQVSDILRRAFLRLQQEYALLLMAETTRKATEAKAAASANESKASAPAIAASTAKAQWQAGAAGVILYIADRTLYCANVGDALAVLSRGGTAQSVSTKHNPLDRPGTERIRASEGWVSLRGYVNDMLDVSRSFGYFHLNPILTAAPMVACVELEDSDEFVIVASRALWEHMSFQTAVDIARTERGDLMIAAQKLRDFAISYGAEESIMVMIVGVGDLFQNRTTPGGTLDTSMDYFRKAHNRRERGANLVGDRTLARLEREVAPPVGQVALVFTDIKNSTSLWETNGGMHSAMRLHNVLLRRQLRSVGGYEVKTEGDAFMVSFPTVTSALLWCFNCQLALLREDWPQEILESEDGKEILDASGDVIYRGLSVRMGVHWGRPVCEADPITRRMDYFGPMVNRSARVSGAADGGQIMASKDFIHELTGLLSAFDEAGGSGQVDLDETDLTIEEDHMRLLPSNVRRDVVLLRRMGFGISEVGERKLKGLETAEVLNLVYPKALAGRMATREDAPAPQVFEPTLSLLSIDEIKALGMICVRLEALSNAQLCQGLVIEGPSDGTNGGPLASDAASIASASTLKTIAAAASGGGGGGGDNGALVAASTALTLVPAPSRQRMMEEYLARRPELLSFAVRDDATDEELAAILQQLVTRTCNALAMIMIRLQVCAARRELPAIDAQAILGLIAPFRDLFG